MQLLTEGSEEGVLPGLGWIRGSVIKFRQDRIAAGLKIPHMGWTDVKLSKPSGLFEDMYEDPRFYFVHSYHPLLKDDHDALVRANYGYDFVAGMERGNVNGGTISSRKKATVRPPAVVEFCEKLLMKRVRIIPVLLIQKGGLVKSVRFKGHKYVGDPINTVKIFNEKEVDEIVVLDISATSAKTPPNITQIKEIASEAFMPLVMGGGITKLEEIKELISIGVEKVDPEFQRFL